MGYSKNWMERTRAVKAQQRRAKSKFSGLLRSIRAQSEEFDIFHVRDMDIVDGGDQRLTTLQAKSLEITRDFLNQFDFPLMPELKLLNARSVKRAEINPDKVISAEIYVEAKCTTATGAREYLEIPVTVVKGSLVPPSTVYHNGREALLTQSFIDDVVRRATSYTLPPLQRGWNHAPLSHETLQYAVDVRNDLGYLPRENAPHFGLIRSSRLRKKAQMWGWSNTETRDAFLAIVNTPEFRNIQGAATSTDEMSQQLEMQFGADYPEVMWREIAMLMLEGQTVAAGKSHRRSRLNKTRRVSSGTPPGWKAVVDIMEAAEAAGEDTFPRPFDHIAKTYIAEIVPVLDYYDWEIHMVNAGYAINPRGDNRGRMVSSSRKRIRPHARRAGRINRLRRR